MKITEFKKPTPAKRKLTLEEAFLAEYDDFEADLDDLLDKVPYNKILAANLKKAYPQAPITNTSDMVQTDDGFAVFMEPDHVETGGVQYVGLRIIDAYTKQYKGVLGRSIQQITNKFLTLVPDSKPAMFIYSDESRGEWDSMGAKLGYRIIQINRDEEMEFDDDDDEDLEEEIRTQFEASYEGNIGFVELVQFYKEASKPHVDLLKRLIAADKTKEAWQLIQKVTGTELVGKEFNEGVGLIRKGSNVTPDVGEGQTRIEAEKLGFTVTDDGVPPIPKNGVPELFEDVIDMTESVDALHAEALRDHLNENRAILESQDDFKSVEKFISQYKIIPTPGENYMYSSLVITPIMGLINIAHTAESAKLLKINDRYAYFQLASGEVAKYPETDKDLGSALRKILFFKSVDDLNKFKTGLMLKFGQWKITKKILESQTHVAVMENIKQLDELNMSPGRLQKEVSRIIDTAAPVIGLEFEVIVPADKEGNPDVNKYTQWQDLVDFFELSSEEDMGVIDEAMQEWMGEKQSEWAASEANSACVNPLYGEEYKVEFMTDNYTQSGEASDYLERIKENIADETGEEVDINDDEITEEIANESMRRAYDLYKKTGKGADEWPVWDGMDPYVLLYHEIFVDDDEDAKEYFREKYYETFYEDEAPYNEDYSYGSFLLSNNINSMGDVYLEWQQNLIWPGGAFSEGDFDNNLAEQMASEMTHDLGIETEVNEDPEDGSFDYNIWNITSDPSVKADGNTDVPMEIVTAKMPYQVGISEVEEFMQYLSKKGAYANETTGLHINVSMENIDHSKLDYSKLVVMIGDSHIQKQFGREFNEYAVNALTSLGEWMDPTQGFERDKPGKAKSHAALMQSMKKDLNNVVAKEFKEVDFGKYASVGLKDNRIEFRSAGGKNYLDNFNDILNLINRFVYAYAVAADPEAHKKEYAKKLYKLASNVGGDASKTSMTLFAGFASGVITKDELIRQLKAKRQAAQQQPEVDTGEAEVEKSFKDKAIAELVQANNSSEAAIRAAWDKGMGQEMPMADNEEYAQKRVYARLKNDIGHYYR